MVLVWRAVDLGVVLTTSPGRNDAAGYRAEWLPPGTNDPCPTDWTETIESSRQ